MLIDISVQCTCPLDRFFQINGPYSYMQQCSYFNDMWGDHTMRFREAEVPWNFVARYVQCGLNDIGDACWTLTPLSAEDMMYYRATSRSEPATLFDLMGADRTVY